MILVDTSVWIDFFRGDYRTDLLRDLLESNEVRLHPWVLGELALGSLGSRRVGVLNDLSRIGSVEIVPQDEVLAFVEHHALAGRGVGWVDVNLLASARVGGVDLWTHDRRLRDAAVAAGVGVG